MALGYDYRGENEDHWLTMGLSIPLPFFTSSDGLAFAGQANYVAAKARAEQAAQDELFRLGNTLQIMASLVRRLGIVQNRIDRASRRLDHLRQTQATKSTLFDLLDADNALHDLGIEKLRIEMAFACSLVQIEVMMNSGMSADGQITGIGQWPMGKGLAIREK